MSERTEDLPKMMAGIIITIPKLTFRTGWAYLKMRKRAQKISKSFETGMINEGMPPELAHRLAEQFETDLSIRNIAKGVGGPFRRNEG